MSADGRADGPSEGLSLEAKIRIAKVVVEDALERFDRPVVMWTGGKDSMLALWFVRQACLRRDVRLPPCLFVDHGTHFEETWRLLDDVAQDWNLEPLVVRNEELLAGGPEPGSHIKVSELSPSNQKEVRRTGYRKSTFPYSLENLVSNHLLKTVPMNDAIREHRFEGVITGIRWDEGASRARERFISPRTDPPHARIHPILHFAEREVWMETLRRNLPIHPLYAQGWRSIDGRYDSHQVSEQPAWEQDLETTPERSGRAQDKERLMERLRELGYM